VSINVGFVMLVWILLAAILGAVLGGLLGAVVGAGLMFAGWLWLDYLVDREFQARIDQYSPKRR
jgi:predicted PurR-regulated permease PerM